MPIHWQMPDSTWRPRPVVSAGIAINLNTLAEQQRTALKDWVEAGGLLSEPYEQPVLLSSMGCSADRRTGMARHVDCRSGRTRS